MLDRMASVCSSIITYLSGAIVILTGQVAVLGPSLGQIPDGPHRHLGFPVEFQVICGRE